MSRPPLPTRPYLIALCFIGLIALMTYYAFHPSVPFVDGYRVEAIFKSSNGLRNNSPVRVGGVDVGKVVGVEKGPGATTIVVMEIDDDGRPVHSDATARIRPRVFLEGGFQVQLKPGSPSAPELPDNGTIPLAQTVTPVQFHQALTVFEAPARDSLRTILDSLAGGFADGGAEGLRKLAPQLAPLSRDLAWVGEALRGTEPGDVSSLVRSVARINRALDRDPEALGALTENLATTARVFADHDDELAATLDQAAEALRVTPDAMRALGASLPALERASRHVAPALPVAPGAFRETTAVLRELGKLVAPDRRARSITALETALVDLPGLVGSLAQTFPTAKPLSDCLSSHVLPTFKAEVPDGSLSSGRPVWQDFAHALVGLSSASQNFDGNGHALRYQAGFGDGSTSLSNVPGLGQLLTNAPTSLRSRPLRRSDGKPPPQRGDAPCSEQPKVDLNTPSGGSGLTPASRPRAPRGPVSIAEIKRLLAPASLERLLKGTP